MKYEIQDSTLGKIEVRDLPLPQEFKEVSATYTPSGRILISRFLPEDEFEIYTVEDDGENLKEVFKGKIPQHKTANGIRFMVFEDNQRVLLGDYVLEAKPDLDHTKEAALVPVIYPKELMTYPSLFRHWSEIIISPDGTKMIWTMLTFTGANNFIGELKREQEAYVVSDVYCISSVKSFERIPGEENILKPLPLRGGEVKQFIQGGEAISLVGNSDSISDSVVEELRTGDLYQFSQTPGYEETAIFSPDETLAICMSTRFSPKTNCAVLGQVPLPHSMYVRGSIINAAYNYAIGSNRIFRMGNIGPALVDAQKTREEGRSYKGADLSDPDNVFVYVSPLSFSPDSRKALVNMHTRLTAPVQQSVVRVVTLLDRAPAPALPKKATPSGKEIPYALTLEDFLKENPALDTAGTIQGEHSGRIVCFKEEATGEKCSRYEHYSADGKTFYEGTIRSLSPANMFAAGDVVFTGDLTVTGEHQGRLDLHLCFTQKSLRDPVMLSFDKDEEGLPQTRGYAEYDGERVNAADMIP